MILTREQYQIIGTKVYKFVHYFNVPTTNIGTVFNDFFIKYAGDVLVLLYICFIILIICEKLFEKSLKNSIITNLFYYIESELSKLNGVVIIISVIFVVIFLDLLILVSSFTEVYYNSLVVWILIMVIYIVFIIPVFILYDEGFYFLAFLRGSASKNSLLWEFVVDYMSVISFFLRINIQLIRVLIITVFFLVYNELYDNSVLFIYNVNIDCNNFNFNNYYLFFLNKIFLYMFYFLFELSHFWLLFFVQTTVFTMILTILVQFLYTCFLFNKLEGYFSFKRSQTLNK